eukprot:2202118-Amphidinium_carterae.2
MNEYVRAASCLEDVAVEEDAEEAPQKSTGKAPQKGKQPRKPAKPSAQDGWRKCTLCKKFKETADYHADKGRCRGCDSDVRSLRRTAQSQGQTEYLEQIANKDATEFEALIGEFRKARAASGKVKFAFQNWRDAYTRRVGSRTEEVGKMMWHGEWLEDAKLAKHGYLTPEEAEDKWKQWVQDSAVKKDNAGPRGFMRVSVPDRTEVIGFDEGFHERALERVSGKKAEKDMTAEQLQSSAEQVFNESESILDEQKLRHQLSMAAGTDGMASGSAFAPDLLELAAEVTQGQGLTQWTLSQPFRFMM